MHLIFRKYFLFFMLICTLFHSVFTIIITLHFSKQQEILKYCPSLHKVTKSVCTGTRAIVRTLPSGHISDEAWEKVVCHRTWRPSRNDLRPILTRGAREDSRVCRGVLRFVGVNLQQVRIEYKITMLVCMTTQVCHKSKF